MALHIQHQRWFAAMLRHCAPGVLRHYPPGVLRPAIRVSQAKA